MQDVRGRDRTGLVPGELLAGADRGEDRLPAEHDVPEAHAAGVGGPHSGGGVAARVVVGHQVIDGPAPAPESFRCRSSRSAVGNKVGK